MESDPFTHPTYTIRRKVLKIFGASFQLLDPEGQAIGFCKQKAFKLKEDLRVYSDESMTRELLSIQARQIVDFGAAYDIVDARDGVKVGAARRKGLRSIVRDQWEVLDASDAPAGTVLEDSAAKALLRRFIAIVPQTFELKTRDDQPVATLKVHFNPFIYRMTVSLHDGSLMDPRLILGTAMLVAAIEGRQES